MAHSATSTDRAAWRIAVTSSFMTIGWPASAARTAPIRKPSRIAAVGLVQGQALLGAELGRHPDLGVGDAVGGEVLGALGGDPGDRVAATA